MVNILEVLMTIQMDSVQCIPAGVIFLSSVGAISSLGAAVTSPGEVVVTSQVADATCCAVVAVSTLLHVFTACN